MQIKTNQEMIDYLDNLIQNGFPLNMFRAMVRALKENDLQSAFVFYKNDRDKLFGGSRDKEIRNIIEDFFLAKELKIFSSR